MVKIIQNGEETLRKIAKKVSVSDIKKPELQKILKDMSDALDSQDDGVAIAAPQIDISLRIFAVSGKVFDEDFINGISSFRNKEKYPNKFFINPEIIKISNDKKMMDEGCLSVRPLFGKVRRATKATVEAYNEEGKKFTMEGSGLLAHIFQHEIDHLEGILFIDKAKNLREVFQ
jgi:peptide deformylase